MPPAKLLTLAVFAGGVVFQLKDRAGEPPVTTAVTEPVAAPSQLLGVELVVISGNS